jgi:uncharacterized protein YlxW (UPF0749 family)
MNPIANRFIPKENWVLPVSLLCLVLGFMLTLAWVTDESRPTRLGLMSPGQQARVASGPIDLQEASRKLSDQVARLQEEKTKLESTLSSQTGGTKVLNEELQDLKVFAGLTKLEGPGVCVTLKDSTKQAPFVQDQIIHDVDVLRVVNELWNAGAEGISVNGLRWSNTTSARCVGSTILVNNTVIASPIKVRAIGDPSTMLGALNLPGGVMAEVRGVDPAMAMVEGVKWQALPAFTGNTSHKVGKVPTATK